jgi:hypothetical protein
LADFGAQLTPLTPNINAAAAPRRLHKTSQSNDLENASGGAAKEGIAAVDHAFGGDLGLSPGRGGAGAILEIEIAEAFAKTEPGVERAGSRGQAGEIM